MNQSYFKTFLQEGDVDMATVKFSAAAVLYVSVTPASMVTVRRASRWSIGENNLFCFAHV